MVSKNIFLLIDYRDMFYSSTREVAGSMDILKLQKLFEQAGYCVFVERFSDVDFSSNKYRGSYVLYQSSEDPDLRYKSYIEDILLGLSLIGAVLVPRFELFRAHHNKVFMEILRIISNIDNDNVVHSQVYGTLEDLDPSVRYPAIVKPSAGSRSKDILLVNNDRDLANAARFVSRSYSTLNLRRSIKSFFLRTGYKAISQHRNKFVVQDYIDELKGDYKVLIYGDRYFVLERENRVNDFRASGSGLLKFPEETPKEILSYASEIYSRCDTPFASLDIAMKEAQCFLLEFQFVSFGQYALERSNHYYTKGKNRWERIEGFSHLESTFVYAVDSYLHEMEKRNA